MSGNDLIILEEIRSRIYTIRGVQVMLDSDLAEFYGVAVKRLNEQVKRNLERFPEDFMFQLSGEEYNLLRSQNVTLEKWDPLRSQNATIEDRRGQHRIYLPYAFTPKQWIEKSQQTVGQFSSHDFMQLEKPIAKQVAAQFETKIRQQAVAQLTQIPWRHN